MTEERQPSRVLIVDDEPNILELLESNFVRFNAPFKREYAMHAAGALGAVETTCYDALLLDVDLPDMTGGTAAILINKFDPTLPIALFTNHSQEVVQDILDKVPTAVFWDKHALLVGNPSKPPYKLISHPQELIERIQRFAVERRCEHDTTARRKPTRTIADAPHHPLNFLVEGARRFNVARGVA
jgi:CheY-like chemotaxis protein